MGRRATTTMAGPLAALVDLFLRHAPQFNAKSPFDTASDGAPITLLPTTGPAGTQGSATVVWLLPGESPGMADGQLTGAAQYAQGLGQTIAGPITIPSGAANNNMTIPPNIRTLLLSIQNFGIATDVVTNVEVIGNSSGAFYYNAPPYLHNFNANRSYQVVVPISSVLDPTIDVVVFTTSNNVFKLTVVGDTAAYDESVFYNGAAFGFGTAVAATSVVTLINGPARILSGYVEAAPGGTTQFLWNGASSMRVDSPAGGSTTTESSGFPAYTILPAGQSIQGGFTTGAGAVMAAGGVAAYP